MQIFSAARRIVLSLSWLYLALLAAWFTLNLLTGDRFALIGLITLLAVYLFVPLPAIGLAALVFRRPALGAGALAGGLVVVWIWGGLFLPPPAVPAAPGPALRVLTFNVLATHNQWQPLAATIQAADADVVMLQELNPAHAAELQAALGEKYPYAVLEPRPNATGIGVLSKYPLAPAPPGQGLPEEAAGLAWIGGPQVLTLTWEGETVTLVNFHMRSTPRVRNLARVAADFQQRNQQARILAEIGRRPGPVILAGDANSVPLSDAHRILTTTLYDAWQAAGFGLGHTFPSRSTVPGSDRVQIGEWYVPPWLARIDYVFHNAYWQTAAARLATVDGVSDHRGLMVELIRRDPD